MFRLLPAFCLAILLGAGCGVSVYQPRTTFDPNDSRAITDADIQKAFQARPQLRSPARLAFYEMGRLDEKLPPTLRALGSVSDIYEIPSLLVEGRRHYETDGGRSVGTSRSVRISLKKLRLLAARAHCDLLILSSTVSVVRSSPNWTMFLAPLLFTQFFVPMLNLEVTLRRELYVVDVRNGYLYRQVRSSETLAKKYVNMFAIGTHRRRLMVRLQDTLRRVTLQQVQHLLAQARRPAAS